MHHQTIRILVFCTFAVLSALSIANEQYQTLSSPKNLPQFALKDHSGERFDLSNLKGHWSLMFMGFTSCPDVCPITLLKLEGVRAELSLRFTPEKIPNVIFLAVDPVRDRPTLQSYLTHFHPENIGITGDKTQLDILVGGIDGFYRLEKPKYNNAYYDVTHTASISVINPLGQLVAQISPPFIVQPMADFLTRLIRQGGGHE